MIYSRIDTVIVVLVCTTCCQADESVTETTFYENKIAFAADRDGNQDIYTINSDGTGLARLTNHEANDRFPALSPDGRSIAFVSDRDGNLDIYTIHSDGTELARLTNHEVNNEFPALSPDGRSIAFVSDRDGEDQIYLAAADGTSVRKLTDTRGAKRAPCWAPDGNRLAYATRVGGKSTIRIIDRLSGKTKRLCEGHSPSWSPDGKRILLISGNLAALGVVDASGGKSRRFFDPDPSILTLFSCCPRWSPDGGSIVFAHTTIDADVKRWEIYTGNQDGSKSKRLTNSAGQKLPLGFSPDGKSIVFARAETDTGGDSDIYIMNLDGTGVRRLTHWAATIDEG